MRWFRKNLLHGYIHFYVFIAKFMRNHGYQYDVFISHAVEDKLAIANELCGRLEKAGLKIWYSGIELLAGDNISDTVLAGLDNSRYGIAILSKHYLSKSWTIKEFYLLFAKEKDNGKVILPVIYDVTIEELAKKDLDIAGRMGIHASKGMDHVVQKILESIQKEEQINKITKAKKIAPVIVRMVTFVLVLMCISFAFYWQWQKQIPPTTFVNTAIKKHIEEVQTSISSQYISEIKYIDAKATSIDTLEKIFKRYNEAKGYHRNGYELFDGTRSIHFKKNIESELHIDADALTPYNAYLFKSAKIYSTPAQQNTVSYFLVNTKPATFTIDHTYSGDDEYKITVSYKNNIRAIEVTLVFPESGKDTKKQDTKFSGFVPIEVYSFQKSRDRWMVKSISTPETR